MKDLTDYQTWGQLQNLNYNYTSNFTSFVKIDSITITPSRVISNTITILIFFLTRTKQIRCECFHCIVQTLSP